MSELSFTCPHCGEAFEVIGEFLGRTTDCPFCNKAVQIPAPESPHSAPTADVLPADPEDGRQGTETPIAPERSRQERTLSPRRSLALAAVCILAAGIACWQWTGSPRYSAGQIVSAVKRHDLPRFQRSVDTESVVSRAFDDLMALKLDEEKPETAAERLGTMLGEGIVRLVKPRLIAEAQAWLARWVEDVDFSRPSKGATPKSEEDALLQRMHDKLQVDRAAFKGIEYTRREGNIALVGLTLHNATYKSDFTLELKLRRAGHYWQLAEVSNLKSLLETFQRLEEKQNAELMARIDELNTQIPRNQEEQLNQFNAQIRKRMANILQLVSSTKERKRDPRTGNKTVDLSLQIHNNTNKTLSAFSGVAKVFTREGRLVKELRVSSRDPLRPGGTRWYFWTVDVSEQEPAMIQLYETRSVDLDILFEPQLIGFEDGTRIELLRSP